MKSLGVKLLREIGIDTPNAEAIVTFKLMAYAPEFVHAVAEELRERQRDGEDPRQGWLALPEYQHVPADIARATQQELRARIAKIERRIASYDYARRSAEKLKADKAELRELKRIDARTSTLFAGAPELDVNRAMEAYQSQLESPARKQRAEASKARWRPNENSTTSGSRKR